MRQYVIRLREGLFLSARIGVWAVQDARKATRFTRAGAEAAKRFLGDGALIAQIKDGFPVYVTGEQQ